MMSQDHPELAVLRRCWARWTAAVEVFARRRGSQRVDAQAYARLHQELLLACRALAGSAEEGGAAFYDHLEGLARPWLTPRVLAQADREILLDLLLRCRRAERALGGRSWVPAARRWAAALGLLALAGGTALWGWAAGWSALDALDRLRSGSEGLWLAVKRSGTQERLFAAGILLTLVAIFLVSRTARSADRGRQDEQRTP